MEDVEFVGEEAQPDAQAAIVPVRMELLAMMIFGVVG